MGEPGLVLSRLEDGMHLDGEAEGAVRSAGGEDVWAGLLPLFYREAAAVLVGQPSQEQVQADVLFAHSART